MILATTVALAVVVPAVGDIASAAPASTTTTATKVTVRAGDSLAGLASRHGVSLSALLRANSLQLTSIVHPGDTLVIPAGASTTSFGSSSGTGSTTIRSAAPSNSTGRSEYIVKAGDALSLIAWRNGVRLTALLQANGLSATSLIMPGQRLRLPAPTRITPSAAPATATVAAAPSPNVKQGSSVQRMVSFAIAQVGAPYKFFSAGPETFDCSGLVVAAFREIGISVPHQSRALAKQGSSVDWRTEAIAAGDLVFTSAMNDPAMITHVGIAIDSTRWVHAVGVGRTVTIGSLPTDSKIMAVQRIAVP
jgi:peptidoglycan endopeptidase LytE